MSSIPQELRLLIEIMKIDNFDSSKTYLKDELFADIDWEIFLLLAKHHRIYPLIYSKLKSIGEKRIPSHVLNALYQQYKNNTYYMLQLCGEMEQVSKLFTENQISLIFLKGPVIAADIYGDISLRTSKDLDILIQINDLKKAEELLLTQGYKREEGSKTIYEWKWNKHHVTYFHLQKGIEIELHWRLHPSPTKEPSFNELWERKRVSMITSYPVYFLGKEDLFLYLVTHGARHGWFRLRWLADIDQIIRKSIIIENNNVFLIQKHYLGKQVLILSSQVLNNPKTEEMKSFTGGKRSRRIAQLAIFYIVEMGHSHINESKGELAINDKHHLFSIKSNLQRSFVLNLYQFLIKSNLQRLIFVIKFFFPSSEDVKTLRLPKPIYFLYFPLRPFLWAWRKTRKPI
ncbi:nucleotidyltransferase family protein [Peribacillus sp. NPDC096622]|uniref:nucleotidyltransferase domain-containing protein n=1 Tax=Peribacillus sp. NPDC096622 TaxID=3364396 RepID=UPI00381D05F1